MSIVTTAKEEIARLQTMEAIGPFGRMGQALVVFDKVYNGSSDITDLNGEWWDSQSEQDRRVMLAGLALDDMVNVRSIMTRYSAAGLNDQ